MCEGLVHHVVAEFQLDAQLRPRSEYPGQREVRGIFRALLHNPVAFPKFRCCLRIEEVLHHHHGIEQRAYPQLPLDGAEVRGIVVHILDALAINILDQFFYALAGPSCHSHWHCVEQHSHHIRHGGVAQGIAATDRLTKHHIRIPCDSTQGHGHGCVDHGGQRHGLRPDLFLQCAGQLLADLGKHLARQLATSVL